MTSGQPVINPTIPKSSVLGVATKFRVTVEKCLLKQRIEDGNWCLYYKRINYSFVVTVQQNSLLTYSDDVFAVYSLFDTGIDRSSNFCSCCHMLCSLDIVKYEW